jgi:hypothetical protein
VFIERLSSPRHCIAAARLYDNGSSAQTQGDPLQLKHFFVFFGGYSNLFATVFRVAASNHQL